VVQQAPTETKAGKAAARSFGDHRLSSLATCQYLRAKQISVERSYMERIVARIKGLGGCLGGGSWQSVPWWLLAALLA
jgi:hypothetical protein